VVVHARGAYLLGGRHARDTVEDLPLMEAVVKA
jgi:hypothetical protein